MNKTEQKKFDEMALEIENLKAANDTLLKEGGIDTIMTQKQSEIDQLKADKAELEGSVKKLETDKAELTKTVEDLMEKVSNSDKESNSNSGANVIKISGTKYQLKMPKSYLKGKLVTIETLKNDGDLQAAAIEAKILIEPQ